MYASTQYAGVAGVEPGAGPPVVVRAGFGWQRAVAAAALQTLLAAIDATVPAFATPPETFNPPAYIVGFPTQVQYDRASFGVDLASLPILVACGPSEADRVDELLDAARHAVAADPSAGGVLVDAHALTQGNWRRLNVAGADVLAADLVLEIRM
jgi:hypothetical protein